MIDARIQRMENLVNKGKLKPNTLSRISYVKQNLETAASNNTSLKQLFPNLEKPIFIVEGLIYFLSQQCIDWLLAQISSYTDAAILIDYWPADAVNKSLCFRNFLATLPTDFIPEKIISPTWDNFMIDKFKKSFPFSNAIKIQDYEKMLIKDGEKSQLINQDKFFPIILMKAATTVHHQKMLRYPF